MKWVLVPTNGTRMWEPGFFLNFVTSSSAVTGNMQIFRIPIPDKKRNSFYFLSLFIFILNLIIFLRIITVAETYQKWVGIFGSLICVSGIILSYLKRKQRPGFFHILHFILLTLTWIFLPAVIPAICIAIFTALAYLAGKERCLLIGEAGIQFPSFPSKKLPWRKVSDIIFEGSCSYY